MATRRSKAVKKIYTDAGDRSQKAIDRATLEMLHRVETGTRLPESAKDLIAWLAWHLQHRKRLPDPAGEWLAQALLQAAAGRSADIALCLKRGKGKPVDVDLAGQRAAHIHALIACGCKKTKAARVVAAFFKLRDPLELLRTYNQFARQWRMHVAGLWDPQAGANRHGEPWALWKHLSTNGEFYVTYRSPTLLTNASILIEDSFLKHVAKSGVFNPKD
jgi:hypothetical protein